MNNKHPDLRKYTGSHQKSVLAGAEYKIFDDLLKNIAAHSSLPYTGITVT